MLRKLFVRTWFGKLPDWMPQYVENIRPLQRFGFDWLIHTDYQDYRRRCREKLGIEVNIQPGTRKVADLDPAIGILFDDEIKEGGYDFWGHINLDACFGRIDRYIPDGFLEDLDIFGGDPDAINGIFSIYRNCEKVNHLFKQVPRWRQIFEDPDLHGFDETPFSVAVRSAHSAGEIIFRSGFFHGNDKMPWQRKPNIRQLEDGTLMCVPRDKEISLYHFNRTRRWPLKDPDRVPDLENIARHMPYIEHIAAAKAGFVLEIGAGAGNGSMRSFSRGLRKSRVPGPLHVSVDVDPSCPQYGAPRDPWWHLVVGDSRRPETLLKVQALAGGRKADVIFIDAEHTYDAVASELALWRHVAKPETIWLFHDIWMEGQRQSLSDAICSFAARDGWRYEEISRECNGLGQLTRK